MDENRLKRQFMLVGFVIGSFFPMLTIIADILHKGIGFSLASFTEIHEINPIHFIIELAPFVLAVSAYIVGGIYARLREVSQLKIEAEKNKINSYARYSEEMINGNYGQEFEFEDGDAELIESLEKLRDTLQEAEERERKQLWTSDGLAKFIEVLRSDKEDIGSLTARTISTLVQYMEANQGGIFISEEKDGETVLQMVASYAYDKKKFLEKTISPGEGLVGQAFKEGEKIFLTEVPQDYVNITSGLGESTPSCLLVVPLMLNEEVFGALELASFKVFQDHEIEFVEKLGENIAATISGIKIAETTGRLLKESQLSTEQMRSQEEEMRQNMEELTATQEEMQRKEQEYQQKIDELETKLGR